MSMINDEEIINLYKSGLSAGKIKEKLGIATSSVRRVLKRNDVDSRKLRTDANFEQTVFDRYQAGESSEKIAADLGVNGSTVCRIVKRLGGTIRPPKENKRKHLTNHGLDITEKAVDILTTAPACYDKNIFSYNGNKVSADWLKNQTIEERQKVAEAAFNYFRKFGFPYPSFSEKELAADFNRLKESKCFVNGEKIECIDNAGLKIFKHYSRHYFDVKSPDLPSMTEAFQDDSVLLGVLKNRMGITYKETFNITGNMIRQGLRNGFFAFGPSIFKPCIAKAIYDKYGKENSVVLDISAGFGQRMLGAAACKNVAKYIGIDPWKESVKHLNVIREKYCSEALVNIIESGSEKVELREKIDFCFSSPPFYNKEIYSSESSQAYQNKTFDQFVQEWWRPTVSIVHEALKENGLFVLNMSPTMFDKMIKAVNKQFKLIDTTGITFSRDHLPRSSSDLYFVLQRI